MRTDDSYGDAGVADEGELVEGYRPLSGWAVTALAVSLLSFLAIFNAGLVIFPVIAAVIGLVALRQMGRDERPVQGYWMAYTALILGLGIASGSLTYSQLERTHIENTARARAEYWLELVRQGDMQQAHHLMVPFVYRVEVGASLDEYYANPLPDPYNQFRQPNTEYESYLTVEPEKSIRQAGLNGTITVGPLVETKRQTRDQILSFMVDFQPNYPELVPRRFRIDMRRTELPEPLGVQWNTHSIVNIEPNEPRPIMGAQIMAPD